MKNETQIVTTKTDVITANEATETLFTAEFFRSGTQYYQLCISNTKIKFEPITFAQICNFMDLQNENEKRLIKLDLDQNRQIIIEDLTVNYVYCIDEPQEPYIVNFATNTVFVFVPCCLPNTNQNNEIWENYLLDRFEKYKPDAKRWIGAYCYFSQWEYENISYEKRLSNLLLTGARGTGKSTFALLMGSIFGKYHFGLLDNEQFSSKFNSWKSNKLDFIDESSEYTRERKTMYQALKMHNGNNIVGIERKGKDLIFQKNQTTFIIASNDSTPIFTVFDEMPDNEKTNQFFTIEFKELNEMNDTIIRDLEQSFYHYIQTELKQVFYNEVVPYINTNRWIVSTPITETQIKMYNINKTQMDYLKEEITFFFKEEYLNNGKTFISNQSLNEYALDNTKHKSDTLLKGDLIKWDFITVALKPKNVNGKTMRGFNINVGEVNRLYEKYSGNKQ